MVDAVPLKKAKRRLFRKNVLIALITAAVVIILFFIQILFTPFEMDYGKSELYSHAEMDHAALSVKLYLGTKIGLCRLLTLKYSGDSYSRKTLDRIITYDSPDKPYTDCMVCRG